LILNPLSGPPSPLQAFAPKPVHALFAAHRHGRDAPFPTKMTLTAFGRDKNRRGAPGIFERTGVTPAERRLRRPATPGRRIRDAQTSANRLNPHRQRRRQRDWRAADGAARRRCGDQIQIARRRIRGQFARFDAAAAEGGFGMELALPKVRRASFG